MAGEWSQTTLGAIATKNGYGLVDGPFGSNLPACSYTDSGIPVIRGSNLTLGTGRFVADEFVFVSRETANRLARSLCKPLDIIFTKKGTLGQTGLVPSDAGYDEYLLSSNQVKLTVDRHLADPLYVYYFVSSPDSTEKIIRDSEATGVPKTNVGYLRDFPIALPPLPEQRAIAHILGTLDDKIELNRRMSETLEAMARALFKSWFVDFDPVRAKMECRDPGLPQFLVALFPDSMLNSERGEIPAGWKTGSVGDLCDAIYSGGTPSTRNPAFWNGGIPWLSSGETRQKFIVATEKSITQQGVSNSSTRQAPAMSTVIASAGQGNTRGQTSLLTIDSYVNQSVVALKARAGTSSPYHLFFDLERRYEEFRRVSDAHSSRGSLTTKLLAGLDAVVPPNELILAFDMAVADVVKRIISNLRQARTLADLRDSLLPKLISGELRVGYAEDTLGKAIA